MAIKRGEMKSSSLMNWKSVLFDAKTKQPNYIFDFFCEPMCVIQLQCESKKPLLWGLCIFYSTAFSALMAAWFVFYRTVGLTNSWTTRARRRNSKSCSHASIRTPTARCAGSKITWKFTTAISTISRTTMERSDWSSTASPSRMPDCIFVRPMTRRHRQSWLLKVCIELIDEVPNCRETETFKTVANASGRAIDYLPACSGFRLLPYLFL